MARASATAVSFYTSTNTTGFVIPKTGLDTYDALRAYGAAIALEALAISNNRLGSPLIRDSGDRYEVSLPDGQLNLQRIRGSHRVLALLQSLGAPDPGREAEQLADLLQNIASGSARNSRVTLWAVVEPTAVKAPRGQSRVALQLRGEMLDQYKRPAAELPELAYLAAWGRVSPPRRDRWDAQRGIFWNRPITSGRRVVGVLRLLSLPGPQTPLLHENDPAAVADAALWGGSEVGAACHLLCVLALRGAFAVHGVIVDRMRKVQGGQWQPEAWGVVRSDALARLVASRAGYRAVDSFRSVFSLARAGHQWRHWEEPAHRLADFLMRPAPDRLRALTAAVARALNREDRRSPHVLLDDHSMKEVVRVTESELLEVYEHESVRAVGSALRRLINDSAGWHVWESFSTAQTTDDLTRALCDLLREVVTANRRRQDQGAANQRSVPIRPPSEQDVRALVQLAQRHNPDRVGLAVAIYALVRPSWRTEHAAEAASEPEPAGLEDLEAPEDVDAVEPGTEDEHEEG
ncbi:MAG: hypothetical protein QN144_13740 [Armatimonadota bacterium]|nr:hypothetical protein [Armatimonadota bacterium]MDR7400353.1 hypothetical protein [Armatimonadota bacterium]MDR7464808.1 hypothetical protein [Armatimonadota bacterium]